MLLQNRDEGSIGWIQSTEAFGLGLDSYRAVCWSQGLAQLQERLNGFIIAWRCSTLNELFDLLNDLIRIRRHFLQHQRTGFGFCLGSLLPSLRF